MPKKKIICFDVDGTLVENKTSFIKLIESLECPVNEVLSIYNAAMTGKISFMEGERQVTEIFRSSDRSTKKFIEHIFDNEQIKSDVFELVESLKNKGYLIWLISGAIDILVGAVAQKIGAAGFYAHSSLEFDEQGKFSKINYNGNQNPWKAKVVCELAAKYNISVQEIIFVGDGENDIEAFRLTGRGIAVYPYDERLEKIAWKTVRSLSEIKDILQ